MNGLPKKDWINRGTYVPVRPILLNRIKVGTIVTSWGIIITAMVIKNSSPLAGVDGVFNAIMVTGDCVGDVMFYGKGAGKLPTASAVVADVVDAVKHSDRSKKIFWEKPTENIMADIDSKKFEYFVRTTDSAENVQKIFGKCEFVDNIIDNESAFVTSPLTKSEVEEKLAKLSDVVANIRVMD